MSNRREREKSLEELARENIVRLRKARGWSQTEVAQRMSDRGFEGFGQMTVSRTEKGERPLRVSELEGYAEVFGESVASLWGTDRERARMRADRELTEAVDDLWTAARRYIDAQKELATVLDEEINDLDEFEAYVRLGEVATPPQEIVDQAVEDVRTGTARASIEDQAPRTPGPISSAIHERIRREVFDKPEGQRSAVELWRGQYGQH